MKKELAKIYDFKAAEDKIYAAWLEKGYFHAEPDESRTPFTIVIPPPNITGQLHLGHALDGALQDILIRFKKMQGYNALWLPGCDHASISTEVKITEALAKEGLTKEQLGREAFLRRAWEWKEEYGGRILTQFKKLGCACDWARTRFTLDEGCSRAVREVFIRMYRDGKIYRGEKLINWCPHCRTTISDAEVEHSEKDGSFWHLRYEIENGGGFLDFATTRPETILGDTAIAVNPADPRYTALVGKSVNVPIIDRKIPIIADEYVDTEFGTGVVKITPAHDPNDYEVGLRHGLPVINVMNDDGTMNQNAGKYAGQTASACRSAIIEDFKGLGLFIKEEPIRHAVGVHERCGGVVEPLIRKQWFVAMEELAKPAIAAYTEKRLNIVPERFGKIYLNWLNNIRDWCVSRQLWWGHRIPAYYCAACGAVSVGEAAPEKCACGGSSFSQDEDVLDTWFSSALWPFSTLGWPERTPELKYFYPTSALVTGYDIIFFWVIRMVFSGLYNMGEVPFKDVFFHGIIRDAEGRKMSKSLGNGIDPIEVIDKYGADALRASLIAGASPGSDSRFKWEKVESARNFLNKLWNSARFILMFDTVGQAGADDKLLKIEDKWILSRANDLAREVTDNLNNYELGVSISAVVSFVRDEFCDWYIEMVKYRLYNDDDQSKPAALRTLKTVLVSALKLLHPFIPFITEEIFLSLQDEDESLLTSKWPVYDERLRFPKEAGSVDLIKAAVKNIRGVRLEMNVPPSKKIKVTVVSEKPEIRELFSSSEDFFKMLSNASELETAEIFTGNPKDYAVSVIPGASVYLPLSGLVDAAKELERLSRERDRLLSEIKRAEGKLGNKGFTDKAPRPLIEEELAKLEKYREMLAQVEKRIEALPG
ncbi:MAG: valine--tRNA ligase [Clostridiales bacterium]|jgi:valyl-tRNA synthetase|nr:valine--tRNA ligase [Clostridiales bacterium]